MAFVFWLVLRGGGLPILPDASVLGAVRWWTVGAYALTLVGWSVVRAMRTRHLLRPIANVPPRQILAVSWIGFLAIFVLPFRLGEVVRPTLYHNKGNLSFAAATGTVGAERIIDGLILMIVLGIALPLGRPLSPLPDHIGKLPIPVVAVPAAAYSMLVLFICAFFAMALFYWRREFARRVTSRVFGLFSPRLGDFLSRQVEKMSEGFRFLPSPKHFVPYLAETFLYWALAAAGMWLLAWGCGLHGVTFAQACTFMGVLGLGIIVPGAPGYFGAFQGSVYAGIALYFDESVVLGPGSAYVFLLYVVQLGMMFVHAAAGTLIDRDHAPAAANVDGPSKL
ncbi:MAG: flippase-like domain-containing protein [Deltaproteobacteria bacterium]|nr:flippase-like domain-containing protein [Deltaproteobacteria bacterium]